MTRRAGVTLLELIVVLALLSIIAGVVSLSFHAAPPVRIADANNARVLAARDSALRFGHPVSIVLSDSAGQQAATALADGRVIADAALRFDPLSGHPYDASR